MTLVAGIVFAVLHPPVLTSTATVLLAPQPQSPQAATSNGAPDPYTATQEVISQTVTRCLRRRCLLSVQPCPSLSFVATFGWKPANSPLITVTAKGRVAADAEATANAVASSYIGYVNSAGNPAGHKAVMLELATGATGRSLPVWLLIVGGFSALYGAIVGAIGTLVFAGPTVVAGSASESAASRWAAARRLLCP